VLTIIQRGLTINKRKGHKWKRGPKKFKDSRRELVHADGIGEPQTFWKKRGVQKRGKGENKNKKEQHPAESATTSPGTQQGKNQFQQEGGETKGMEGTATKNKKKKKQEKIDEDKAGRHSGSRKEGGGKKKKNSLKKKEIREKKYSPPNTLAEERRGKNKMPEKRLQKKGDNEY